MGNLLTSLFDYKVKRHALISAIVFFIVDKLLYLYDVQYMDNRDFLRIYFNYLVAIGLLTVVNCKDKVDDERSLLIRYSILKQSLGFFVIAFGFIALFSNQFHIQSLSILTVLYCTQGLLALHVVLLYLGNRYNPSWLFKEKTAPKDFNKMMIGFFYGFYLLAALLIGISFLIKH